jgi:hypothetical protein
MLDGVFEITKNYVFNDYLMAIVNFLNIVCIQIIQININDMLLTQLKIHTEEMVEKKINQYVSHNSGEL